MSTKTPKGTTNDHTETVAAYSDEHGRLCTIDHLGICAPSQAGTYAIYRDGEYVTEFIPMLIETVIVDGLSYERPLPDVYLPEHMSSEELIGYAKLAVIDADEEEAAGGTL